MDHEQARLILGNIDYPKLYIELYGEREGNVGSVRVSGYAANAVTGVTELQGGRFWPLTSQMVESEVVQTVFMAIAQWEEHERRERFRFLGQRVFSPHLDLGKIAIALRLGMLKEQVRDDAR